MRKVILAGCAITYLGLASCKKADDGIVPYNTWTAAGTEYTATQVTKTSQNGSGTLTAVAGSGSSSSTITFYFLNLPTTSGTYNVAGNMGTGTNDVYVLTASSVNGKPIAYATTGYDSKKATVTISSNGKISITMPAARAKNLLNTKDSVMVSATAITEQ